MGKMCEGRAVACGKEIRDLTPKKKTWLYLVGADHSVVVFPPGVPHEGGGGGECPQRGPVLLCSNHLAKRDPVLLGLSQKRQVFYMAKEELFRNKFLGGLFRMLGAFPVKRGHRRRGRWKTPMPC